MRNSRDSHPQTACLWISCFGGTELHTARYYVLPRCLTGGGGRWMRKQNERTHVQLPWLSLLWPCAWTEGWQSWKPAGRLTLKRAFTKNRFEDIYQLLNPLKKLRLLLDSSSTSVSTEASKSCRVLKNLKWPAGFRSGGTRQLAPRSAMGRQRAQKFSVIWRICCSPDPQLKKCLSGKQGCCRLSRVA